MGEWAALKGLELGGTGDCWVGRIAQNDQTVPWSLVSSAALPSASPRTGSFLLRERYVCGLVGPFARRAMVQSRLKK